MNNLFEPVDNDLHKIIENSFNWVIILGKELKELTILPLGWDCYDGVPISEEIVEVIKRLLTDYCQE